MTHDPLCPWRKANKTDTFETYFGGGFAVCHCDLIAKVREDERDGIQAVRLRTLFNEQGYRDGQRDMLARAIAAVDGLGTYGIDSSPNLGDALAALRALGDSDE